VLKFGNEKHRGLEMGEFLISDYKTQLTDKENPAFSKKTGELPI